MHNGSAADFGSACEGSIPSSPATIMNDEISKTDKKIAFLMDKVHSGDYDKNTNLSHFNTDADSSFMMKMGLRLQGWTDKQILEKIILDTRNDLTSRGYISLI